MTAEEIQKLRNELADARTDAHLSEVEALAEQIKVLTALSSQPAPQAEYARTDGVLRWDAGTVTSFTLTELEALRNQRAVNGYVMMKAEEYERVCADNEQLRAQLAAAERRADVAEQERHQERTKNSRLHRDVAESMQLLHFAYLAYRDVGGKIGDNYIFSFGEWMQWLPSQSDEIVLGSEIADAAKRMQRMAKDNEMTTDAEQPSGCADWWGDGYPLLYEKIALLGGLLVHGIPGTIQDGTYEICVEGDTSHFFGYCPCCCTFGEGYFSWAERICPEHMKCGHCNKTGLDDTPPMLAAIAAARSARFEFQV